MSCPYYGKHASKELRVLSETHGNQCALITTRHAPCYLETDQQSPDLDACKFKGTGIEIEISRFANSLLSEPRSFGNYPD